MTIDVLEQYIDAVGGVLEISVRKGSRRIALIGGAPRGRGTSTVKKSA